MTGYSVKKSGLGSKYFWKQLFLMLIFFEYNFTYICFIYSDLLSIMLVEYGFPKTLTSREICRKWAATFSVSLAHN